MQPTFADRVRAAIPSVLLTVLIGWALIAGLAMGTARAPDAGLKLFDTPQPEPAARVIPDPKTSRRKAGEAAPPNIRSRATEVVAPPPVVPIPIPPTITVAPVAGPGVQASSGSAERPGPGTGAGGEGNGFGSGGAGDGDGGGGEGEYTPPIPRSGNLRMSDYPPGAEEDALVRTVSVRYYVQQSGRVSTCQVTRSSGNRELDANTCSAIQRRFRYYPSRDPEGRPVGAWLLANHTWDVPKGEDTDE